MTDTIDDIGRRAAAAVTAAAAVLADAEVDTLLDALAASAAVHRRAGRHARSGPQARQPRRWAVVGAAAAVVLAVGAGVLVVANRDSPSELVPGSTAPPFPVSTPPPTTPVPSTSAPSSSTAPPTSAPTATTIPANTGDGLAVSYKNPPPFLEPQPIATVETVDDRSMEDVLVMESGLVVLDGTTATVIAWDGATRTVQMQLDSPNAGIFGLAAGPGDVLYAQMYGIEVSSQTAGATVAIPLAGEHAGEVVASTPADITGMTERPYGWVGHGPSGIIDRSGGLGGRDLEQLAPYVDEGGAPWPASLDVPEYRRDGDTVTNVDGSQSWPLAVERAAGSGDPYVGPSPPSPAAGGGAVTWERIGPRGSNGDYASGTMQVIAFLDAAGSATWRRVPAGWEVVASDVWGTVIARRQGTQLDLALATPAVGSARTVTAAEQAVTDYLTALAARDYATAATLLGNDGQSLEARADLAPIRDLLVDGASLEDALRDWCEGDARAACWMPARIADTGAAAAGTEPDATIMIAEYDQRDVGPQARFVVGTWEGLPSVYGLPPLAEVSAMTRLRALLGVDELWMLHPDDQLANGRRSAVVANASGQQNVNGPPDVAAVTLAPDRQTLWWSVGDGRTTVTDTTGTVVCSTAEPIVGLVGQPGSYRAIVEREVEAGPMDAPAPYPRFEVDCITGAETAIEPRSWNGGPVTTRLVTAGERTFTLSITDHHAELTDDAGLDLVMSTTPAFNRDGSIVVYGNGAGGRSADPNLTTVVTATDTVTGAELWTHTSATAVIDLEVARDRVIVTTAIDDGSPSPGTASVVALDLATGAVLMNVPATFTLLHVQ